MQYIELLCVYILYLSTEGEQDPTIGRWRQCVGTRHLNGGGHCMDLAKCACISEPWLQILPGPRMLLGCHGF